MARNFLHHKLFVLFIFVLLFTLFNVSFKHNVKAGTIVNTSTFTSQVKDFGAPVYFNQFSWTASTTAGVTAVTMEVRAGNTANPSSDNDPNWTSWTAITNGANVSSSLDGHRYFQYRATLTSEDINQVASFSNVNIAWSNYYTQPVSLIGSPYDAADSTNALGGVSWTEDPTLPTGTEVNFYLRTGNSTSTLVTNSWTEIASTTSTYITPGCSNSSGVISCNNSVIPESMKDGTGDEFLQYKI